MKQVKALMTSGIVDIEDAIRVAREVRKDFEDWGYEITEFSMHTTKVWPEDTGDVAKDVKNAQAKPTTEWTVSIQGNSK